MRPLVIGLTGSIGMGKSTTAAMFRDLGLPLWDADAAVHRLYGEGGEAVEPIREACPAAVAEGRVDRKALRRWLAEEEGALRRIERIVHPLVARERTRFVADAGTDLVVLDIPLLFETGADDAVDEIVVVSAPLEVQRQRVLTRGGMSETEFDAIVARQVPDDEKRRRADWVVPTVTMEEARGEVERIVRELRGRHA